MTPKPTTLSSWPLTTMAILVVTVWGGVAFFQLPRQEDPHLTWRLANVVTQFPGASAERIESRITEILEEYIADVDQVEHITSVSRPGVSLVQVELSDDVTDAAPVWQKVRQRLSAARHELPPAATAPELDDEIMGTATVLVAVTSVNASYRQLENDAELLADRLRFLPDTASTSLYGTQAEVIEVEPVPAQLATLNLSFQQLAKAIQQRNTQHASGRVSTSQDELLVETSGEFITDDELRDMVVMTTPEGRVVRLKDIADVRRRTALPAQPLARVNGERAILVGTRARDHLRQDRYGDQVAQIVAEMASSSGASTDYRIVHSLGEYTRRRATELSRTLLLSIVLVFLSTLVFMGWRGALAVTISIPLTGLAVLVLFQIVGLPLNQMSVMAIVMSLGLLVDNAIVVTEQIQSRGHATGDLIAAATTEPRQLAMPLAVSTLTTIAAFVPIYLLPGGTGEFVRAIPVGVAICLGTSLLVAMAVVPLVCTLVLRPAAPGAAATHGTWPLIATTKNAYIAILEGTLQQPWVAIVTVSGILIALASVGLSLRRDFFSPVQRDQLIVDVHTPQGSSLEYTAEITASVEELLQQMQHVEQVTSLIGRNAPLVFYNLTSQELYANHYSQLIVTVDEWRHTAQVTAFAQQAIQTEVADAHCVARILEHGAPFLAPFEVRISGPSIPTLHELGRRTAAILRDSPGVRNVRDNYGNEALQLVADVNEAAASHLAINQQQVADELRDRLDGLPAGSMQEGDHRTDIVVRLPLDGRQTAGDLQAVQFTSYDHEQFIPFPTVARVAPSWKSNSIHRRDGHRTLTVLGYPQFGRTAAQTANLFRPALQQLAASLPSGYSLELGGEQEQRQEAEHALLSKAVYSVGIVLLLLIAEFRSFRLAAIILAVIPLSVAGTMALLWITGWPLNFMAIMGIMMLIGVVVNDAVILVDGYERRRQAGEPLTSRIIAGTVDRTRHVIVTTVSTLAGFLPLAISPSLLWPPLALAVIGGLTCSTLLTLVLIPAWYYVACPESADDRPGGLAPPDGKLVG